MEKNKDYSYNEVLLFAHNNDYDIAEYGDESIGSTFIVLTISGQEDTISFIMTGYKPADGYIYTCIYMFPE